MKKIGIIVLVGVLFVVLWGVGVYNRLVTANQAVDGQWAQVEAQYQRRFDLIPNLVESVKGIFEQEQEVFGKLADARSRYAGAATIDEKVAAAGQVESALGRLLVVMENYPELRSAENVTGLMDELAGTENRVAVERRRFNEQVQSFNTMVVRFPSNMFARMFGFSPREYFESVTGADAAPKVEFKEQPKLPTKADTILQGVSGPIDSEKCTQSGGKIGSFCTDSIPGTCYSYCDCSVEGYSSEQYEYAFRLKDKNQECIACTNDNGCADSKNGMPGSVCNASGVCVKKKSVSPNS